MDVPGLVSFEHAGESALVRRKPVVPNRDADQALGDSGGAARRSASRTSAGRSPQTSMAVELLVILATSRAPARVSRSEVTIVC